MSCSITICNDLCESVHKHTHTRLRPCHSLLCFRWLSAITWSLLFQNPIISIAIREPSSVTPSIVSCDLQRRATKILSDIGSFHQNISCCFGKWRGLCTHRVHFSSMLTSLSFDFFFHYLPWQLCHFCII